MTPAEKIYQRAPLLPADKVVQVLDFIDRLKTTMYPKDAGLKTNRPIKEWRKPIYIASWEDEIDLSREAIYGEDGK